MSVILSSDNVMGKDVMLFLLLNLILQFALTYPTFILLFTPIYLQYSLQIKNRTQVRSIRLDPYCLSDTGIQLKKLLQLIFLRILT